ncbi:MAG: pyruvate carboxyltransferase [Candidatus Bathyarchaeia archaeon]|nr:MAG: pyruvate carboxyltransferase [Candidatus Nezhaarchaeota archaeon WYZ-LMO8]
MNEPWKTDKWFVSHYNFVEEIRKNLNFPEKVLIHDVTLRDGEQQANVIFRKQEKIKVARLLDEAGVQRIEAGMPAVSKEEMEAVKAIASDGLNAKIFAFTRCMKRDVDLALKCGVDGVVMEIPSSDHLLSYAYGWSEDKAIKLAVEATSYAHEHGLHVAFFTIDSTRAKFETCWSLINAVATEGHMDSLVVADTFGVCSPHAIHYFVRKLKERVKKPLEIHCHNDFGLAVANTISAVAAGAEIVHTTVNGIGERAGNASLAEVVMALELLYGVKTGMKTEKLRKLSKVVEKMTRVKMPQNRPIVGDNIFTVESGIIAGWWSRLEKMGMPLEMLPFLPSFVGHDSVKIVLGKKSGKDSIVYKMEKLGLKVPEDKLEQILEAVKTYSEEKKRVLTDEEFKRIVSKFV